MKNNEYQTAVAALERFFKKYGNKVTVEFTQCANGQVDNWRYDTEGYELMNGAFSVGEVGHKMVFVEENDLEWANATEYGDNMAVLVFHQKESNTTVHLYWSL